MASWATVADVAEITGSTVTDEKVDLAQSMIEVRIGRIGDQTAYISTRDLAWLKRAVSFQAAWLNAHPDVLTRLDATSVAQDGASAQVRGDGLVLAPLAKTALRRVSWRGSRSVHTPSVYRTRASVVYPAAEGVVAVFDYPDEDWEPLR